MKYILLILLLCTGCSPPSKVWIPNGIEQYEVQRVFMNNSQEYTVFKNVKNELFPTNLHVSYYNQGTIQVLPDVPADKPMFVVVTKFILQGDSSTIRNDYQIHIHDASEINGGQWKKQLGKQTQTGPVQVIE